MRNLLVRASPVGWAEPSTKLTERGSGSYVEARQMWIKPQLKLSSPEGSTIFLNFLLLFSFCVYDKPPNEIWWSHVNKGISLWHINILLSKLFVLLKIHIKPHQSDGKKKLRCSRDWKAGHVGNLIL